MKTRLDIQKIINSRNILKKQFQSKIKTVIFPNKLSQDAKDFAIRRYGIAYEDEVKKSLFDSLLFSKEMKICWNSLQKETGWEASEVEKFFLAIVQTIELWHTLDRRPLNQKKEKMKEILKQAKKLRSQTESIDNFNLIVNGFPSFDPLNKRAKELGLSPYILEDSKLKPYMNLTGGLAFLIDQTEKNLKSLNIIKDKDYFPFIPSKKNDDLNGKTQFRNFLIRELFLCCYSIFARKPKKRTSTIANIVNSLCETGVTESYVSGIISKIKPPK